MPDLSWITHLQAQLADLINQLISILRDCGQNCPPYAGYGGLGAGAGGFGLPGDDEDEDEEDQEQEPEEEEPDPCRAERDWLRQRQAFYDTCQSQISHYNEQLANMLDDLADLARAVNEAFRKALDEALRAGFDFVIESIANLVLPELGAVGTVAEAYGDLSDAANPAGSYIDRATQAAELYNAYRNGTAGFAEYAGDEYPDIRDWLNAEMRYKAALDQALALENLIRSKQAELEDLLRQVQEAEADLQRCLASHAT